MLYLHKEDFRLVPTKYYNHIRIDVTGISLLRLRKDANIPCDENLENDDMNWMNHVITEVGCFPSYWSFLPLKYSIPHCNQTNDYKTFSKYFARSERGQVYNISDKYEPPCTRMRILSTFKFLDYYETEKLRVDIRYLSREFEEIQNVQDIELDTLAGDIGGIVGMILGVSILQISYLLNSLIKTMIQSLKTNINRN